MRASIEEPTAKLSRAYLQFAILKDQVEASFPPLKRWSLTAKEHQPGLEYRFYLGDIPEPDVTWALLTSEILFNIRCSLDYLVYQLHVRRFRGNVPAREARVSMFPICSSRDEFTSNTWHIAALGQRERRAIQHLQPYVTRNDGWKHARLELSRFTSLQNIDKHRKLHVVTAAQSIGFGPDFPDSCGFRSDWAWCSLKSGDRAVTWTFTTPPPEMKRNEGACLTVSLEYEGYAISLLGTLWLLMNNVALIIERFADRFPKIARPEPWRPQEWTPILIPLGTRPPITGNPFL